MKTKTRLHAIMTLTSTVLVKKQSMKNKMKKLTKVKKKGMKMEMVLAVKLSLRVMMLKGST